MKCTKCEGSGYYRPRDLYNRPMTARRCIDCGGPQGAKARRTDPQTSHDAAASMRGAADAQRRQVLGTLALHGPLTADEIDEHVEWRATTAGRRLKELETAGLVVRTPVTRPTRSGRQATVWSLTT